MGSLSQAWNSPRHRHRYGVLNKSLKVKLFATDIFNTANNDWTMNTYGVFVDKRQSYDRRGIALNVIYNFHPRKSKYKGSSASEDEMKRL